MTDFDYGNTRVRVMKSRLLNRPEIETLLATGSVNALLSALSRTVYRRSVETALTRSAGLESVHDALHNDLADILVRVRTFYPDRAGRLLEILYRFHAVRDLKTVLRGVAGRTPPQEIRPALLAVGELGEDILAELLRAPDPRTVIDLLASLRVPMAAPLMALRVEHPGAGVPAMELALDKWTYRESFAALAEKGASAPRLVAALKLEADLANLLTALRFAFDPAAHKGLRELYAVEQFHDLFVGPGHIAPALLVRAGSRDNVEAAVADLLETAYAPALQRGLAEYAASARLSAFERHLNRHRLGWMQKLMTGDPLGIGIPIGYLALKIQEVNNLRWIAQGLYMDLDTAALRAGLEMIA